MTRNNAMKSLFTILSLVFLFIICGCNSHNDKNPDTSNQTIPNTSNKEKLNTFQTTLSLAETNFNGSVKVCEYIVQHAHSEGVMSHFDRSVAYSRYAASEILKAQQDFDYIYINYKNVPVSLRDDFSEYKRIIDDNVTFIPNICQGIYSDDKIPGWEDDCKKARELYHNINLEIERLKKD